MNVRIVFRECPAYIVEEVLIRAVSDTDIDRSLLEGVVGARDYDRARPLLGPLLCSYCVYL